MTAFDEIRPYTDPEVPAVLARLLTQPAIPRAAAQYTLPRITSVLPGLGTLLARHRLRRRLAGIDSVEGVQTFLSDLFQRMIERSTDGFSVTGAQQLDPQAAYLFVSNHRDIALDSGFMNYALLHAGHPTSRIAVGDNLVGVDYAADLMRLNKSFIVKRGSKGAKAAYAAMVLTSQYIRHSLEEGVSVWIAQRQGRAKDGIDRTEPGLIKMFALAYRKELGDVGDLLAQVRLVPVSISYELDPCDLMKAHELRRTEIDGEYAKPDDEDLKSIVAGITGSKGRVHLAFGEPLTGTFADAESIALAVDAQIIGNLKLFPTHLEAARLTGESVDAPPHSPALALFRERVAAAAPEIRPYLLRQYANVWRNQSGLGSVEQSLAEPA